MANNKLHIAKGAYNFFLISFNCLTQKPYFEYCFCVSLQKYRALSIVLGTSECYFIFSDIDVDKPDKKLVIMYLTEMYNYLEGMKAKERRVCWLAS